MKLTEHQKVQVAKILDGDINTLLLTFPWDETPQGHDFWFREYESRRLSPEAKFILESWLGTVPTVETPKKEEVPVRNLARVPVYYDIESKKVVYVLDKAEAVIHYLGYGDCDIDSPQAHFKLSGESGYTINSTFFNLFDYRSYVIYDLDAGEVFGLLPDWLSTFGLKNTGQFVEMITYLRAKDLWRAGDPYGFMESLVHRSKSKITQLEGFYDLLSLSHFFQPVFSAEGVTYSANYRDVIRGRRTSTTYGRFFRKMFVKATDGMIETLSDFTATLYKKREFTLHEGKERKNFKRAYSHKQSSMLNPVTSPSRKSLANSCMRDTFDTPCHPSEVYASGDFTIYWLECGDGNIGGRVIVYFPEDKPPQAGPCYGICEHSLDLLEAKLEEIGAVLYDDADWYGARLLKIDAQGCGDWVMPYLDLCGEAKDDGDYFVLDKRGSYELCSTEGYIGYGNSYCCEGCEERISEDEVYTNHWGAAYCECCYDERYGNCEITHHTYERDELQDAYTNNPRISWRGSRGRSLVTIGPDVSTEECYYTEENWLLEDMVQDADDNYVSPIYAENNLTLVSDVWYTKEQLAENGLDENGDEIVTEDNESEAA
jgi:hypothetical protein